ncbi:MAG: Uma2 family endonuclease [Chloroflexi bacterium]|nr:Uma2 family endonuclease [Chloroflexota bacterium]
MAIESAVESVEANVDVLPATAPATGVAGPPQGSWTYEDYLALPDDGKRYEVIDGVLYVSPAPSPKHQRRLLNLVIKLVGFVREHALGEVFISPVDLLIPGAKPVQPDALFIARTNPARIDEERNIAGVPDLIVEVASPSTAGYDRREKQDLYARAGVREYWYAHPTEITIELLALDPERGTYRSVGVFGRHSRLPTTVLKGLPFTVGELLEGDGSRQ